MKRLFVFSMVMGLALSSPVNALATGHINAPDASLYNASITIDPISQYYTFDENGNQVMFPTYDDYLLYENAQNFARGAYGETWVPIRTVAEDKLLFHFVGYHSGTSTWAKTNQYVITRNKTYSVSGSYNWKSTNFNLGFSYSYGVATYIPANASKYSRLGVYGDFTFKQVEYAQYKYGQPTGATRVSSSVTRTNSYLEPRYQ